MGRYSKAKALQVKIDEDNEQIRLKDKHHIDDENVVVVEKSNIFKSTVKLLIIIMKKIFIIMLFCLAAIGAFTLLYSDLRQNFINIMIEIINSIFGSF